MTVKDSTNLDFQILLNVGDIYLFCDQFSMSEHLYGQANQQSVHALPLVWTLVHIVSAVGFGVWVFGVGSVWPRLVVMATQVPWSVLTSMSVVLHYFPLIYQLFKTQHASPAKYACYH